MAGKESDALLRAAFNIEQTDDQIPTAADVVDATIDLQLQAWKKMAVTLVGEEGARESYLQMKAALKPVAAEVEQALQEVGTSLNTLADTRRAARAEAAK